MFATLKYILVALFAGEVFCQYINHPYGGFSYVTNSFHQGVGYSYVAPSGQFVNVKYATGALDRPPRISASPQFVYQGAPSTAAPTLSAFGANFGMPQTYQIGRPASPPSAKNLFTPALYGDPASSDKQVQAYNDYLNQLEQENARAAPETEVTTNFDPESFLGVKLGE